MSSPSYQPAVRSAGREPEPVVPVRAADWPDVRGSRVIVGRHGYGWRGDLRADSSVTQGGKTFVPVLTEHDWYRAEAEQVDVFAPLVPISRVWVETVGGSAPAADASPGLRRPVPVTLAGSVFGRRVVCANTGPRGGHDRGLRAVDEIHATADGGHALLVVAEADWYRWAWTGHLPSAMEVRADHVWLE